MSGSRKLWNAFFSFALAMFLDSRFDFLSQSKPVECERAHVGDVELRHQYRGSPSAETPRILRRYVVVVDLAIHPADEFFDRPIAVSAECEDMLMQFRDEIGIVGFCHDARLNLSRCR